MNDQRGRRVVGIVDVAKEAGVAPSTVSRAFRDPDRVNPATIEVIRQAAVRLGYEHRSYRRRAGRSSGIISLVVKNVSEAEELLRGAQDEAFLTGRAVSVIESTRTSQWENSFIEEVSNGSCGVLVASDRLNDAQLQRLASLVPLVVLNRPVPGVASVMPDAVGGARQVLALLKSNGHHAVTYVSAQGWDWADRTRWDALRTIGRSMGMAMRVVGPFSPSVDGGGQAAMALRGPSCPSAVVTYNEQMAAGMVTRMTAESVDVPGRLSVVAFDDSSISSVVSPNLTAVRLPRARIGALGVRVLLALSSNGYTSMSAFTPEDVAALCLPDGTTAVGAGEIIGSNMLCVATTLFIRDSVAPAWRGDAR